MRVVDQIFTLNQISEKARKKTKCRVYVSFMDLEKACDRIIRKHYGRY